MWFENEEIKDYLEMEYKPSFKYTDENIKFNVSMFECKDIDGEYIPNLNLKEYTEEIISWRYDAQKFNWGRQNKRLFPSLIHYLSLATFKYNKFIPYKMYEEVVLNKIQLCDSSFPFTDEQILIGRAYQTYCAYLREVDFAISTQSIFPEASIYKNPLKDISQGIDFIVTNGSKSVFVALKHEGKISDFYDDYRKNAKEASIPYLIKRITAKHNKGDKIELVDIEDIQGLFD